RSNSPLRDGSTMARWIAAEARRRVYAIAAGKPTQSRPLQTPLEPLARFRSGCCSRYTARVAAQKSACLTSACSRHRRPASASETEAARRLFFWLRKRSPQRPGEEESRPHISNPRPNNRKSRASNRDIQDRFATLESPLPNKVR